MHNWLKEGNESVKLWKLIKVAETRLLCFRPSDMVGRFSHRGSNNVERHLPLFPALLPLCQTQSELIKAASDLVASWKTFHHNWSTTWSIKEPQGVCFILFPSQLYGSISICSLGPLLAAGGRWSCGPTPMGCLSSSSFSVWEIRESGVSRVSHSPFNVSRNLSSLKLTLGASRRTLLIPTFSHADSASSHIGAQSDFHDSVKRRVTVMWSFFFFFCFFFF